MVSQVEKNYLPECDSIHPDFKRKADINIRPARDCHWKKGNVLQNHLVLSKLLILMMEIDQLLWFVLKSVTIIIEEHCVFYRADAGTQDGPIYLQALAKYLQQEYMRRPLDKILKMVRQHMIRKVQVWYLKANYILFSLYVLFLFWILQ